VFFARRRLLSEFAEAKNMLKQCQAKAGEFSRRGKPKPKQNRATGAPALEIEHSFKHQFGLQFVLISRGINIGY